MIIPVDKSNIRQAAAVHSASWQESHRAFCAPDLVARHTPERQEQYISDKMSTGSRFYMLVESGPVGIVSVCGSLIEDLYVLPEMQGKGYGTRLLSFAVGQCSGKPSLLILENNHRAKRLYLKAGFRETGRIVSSPNGLDEIELALQEKPLNGGNTMNGKDFIIRPERPEDYGAVEYLIRESFWNVYRPGCLEHYVIHVLRGDAAFIKELDFVMEKDGKIIGQNMFMKTVINADDGRDVDVLTMGPICITPELKRKGYGKQLLDYCLERAAEMGFGAVLFEGNIKFYGTCGFDYSRNFGIRYHDLPEGADSSFFLCKELIPGYLKGVTGVYQTPRGYYVDEAEAEEFDKGFPPKVKLKLPGQLDH